ncbi:tRNA pseudouridine(55) synthase TruB [Alkalimarinus alittae]|uniref:tRNA pseudouridine synthase B n=1 Tax=Alkalimarinus alittae TaxID=2961619 RepID=A0ABY6N4C5_9ALTE|nr:tRNA pseudouridine(55) synthase TruB [Alkalimarinus alittae]UZE96855.1 tRNA pseudouridine(55) synthase TruB [Alkalimarinus alittae]
MGRRKKGRKISGVLLLDKPTGITSNKALQKVRWLFDANKAGHTGNLDPLATGVLPICFGEATKFSRYLLDADKAYRTTAKLGVITDSGDSDGNVLETRPVSEFQREELLKVINRFIGDVEQVPPMYSALKHNGKPLYEYARAGVEIERKIRTIKIFKIELLDVRDGEFDLEVYCSKGTYIRTLVEDIGEILGCGAHVSMLRRIEAGPFPLDRTVTISQLEALQERDGAAALDPFLLPIDIMLDGFDQICLNSEQSGSILQGQAVRIAHSLKSGLIRLYSNDEEQGERFLGMAEIMDDGEIAPRRLVNFESSD